MAQQIFDTRAVAAHFNRAAESYDAEADLQRHYNLEAVNQLQPLLKPDALILDAGCGTGMFARQAAEKNIGWRIIGSDIAATMCALAKPHHTHIVQCNIERSPFSLQAFDAVISAFALQWSNAPDQTISQLAANLKPQGIMHLYSFSEGTLSELREATRYAGAGHVVSQFYPAEYYERWCVNAGLTITQYAEDEHTSFFPTPEALFVHLKRLGATNSLTHRSKGLSGKHALRKIAHAYRMHYASTKGIPSSWRVVKIIAAK